MPATRESLRWLPLSLLGLIIGLVGAGALGWLSSAAWGLVSDALNNCSLD